MLTDMVSPYVLLTEKHRNEHTPSPVRSRKFVITLRRWTDAKRGSPRLFGT
jgi:hypothetical protein